MEKVNIQFHDNYTVSYQHKKILQFVPELSVDGNTQITTPNIPLLVSNSSFPHIVLRSMLNFTKFTDIVDVKQRTGIFPGENYFLSLDRNKLQTICIKDGG